MKRGNTLGENVALALMAGRLSISASTLVANSGTISGSRLVLSSGLEAIRFSGSVADFSGLTCDIISGFLGAYGSGVTATVFSGNVADLSGVTIDIVSGVQGSFSSGITVLSGTPSTSTLGSGYWVVALTSAGGTPKVFTNFSGVIWSVALASGA